MPFDPLTLPWPKLLAIRRGEKTTRVRTGWNQIGDAGAEVLAVSPVFTNLREINLLGNSRLTERGKQILRDTFGDRVKLD